MAVTGFTGISHPFRIGSKGGVMMSTTTSEDITHINESVIQILGTRRLERSMEYHIYSDLDERIFDQNDYTTHSLIKYQIQEALRLEPRIEVEKIEIEFEDNVIYADIFYKVILYQKYFHSGRIKIGGENFD